MCRASQASGVTKSSPSLNVSRQMRHSLVIMLFSNIFFAKWNTRQCFDQVMLRELLLPLSISSLEHFIDVKRNEANNSKIRTENEAIEKEHGHQI